jgi:hypothetical protein
MEESKYKRVYCNQYPCPFEKAILTGRFACTKCQHLNVAEREEIACFSEAPHPPCELLLEKLRQNAQFTLKLLNLNSPLPHAKEVKVQCGGLLGLQAVLFPKRARPRQVKNIDALVKQAIIVFGHFDKLPFQEIIRFINRYQVRKKRSLLKH